MNMETSTPPQDDQNKYLATPMHSSINMHSPPQSDQENDDNESSEDDELEKKFKYLEDDWDSMKRTNQSRGRQCSSDLNSSLDLHQLLKTSSTRHLISSLQRNNPSASGEKWKVRTNDLAFMEILMERRTAIERGGLKGRSLFEALEKESEIGIEGYDDGVCCSCCSSDLVHQEGEKVTSLCFCSSSCSNDGGDEYSSYSLASPSAAAEKVECGKVVVEEKRMVVRVGDGWTCRGRRLLLIGWLAIVTFALCMVSFRSIGRGEEFENGVALFPT